MSVVTQLPPELGGASGKVSLRVPLHLSFPHLIAMTKVAYIDTEGTFIAARAQNTGPVISFYIGTFRPDRIRSIADRFGVDGNMALENILYGKDH